MKLKISLVILITLLLLTVSCSEKSIKIEDTNQSDVTEETTEIDDIDIKNYPDFSWDKMPLYMHVRKSTAFTDEEIKYLADFPLITLEKSTGYNTYGSNEKGTIEAAKAIKNINSEATILYYKNVVINWGNYEEDEVFLKENPEAILTDNDGVKALMPNGTTGFFDISKEYVRNYWLSHVHKMAENSVIDGLFMDANIKVLAPGFFGGRVGDEKQKEIEKGYFSMMENLNTQLGDDNLLLANIIRVRTDFTDSGRAFLKYFNGSYLEGFENESADITYEDYLAKGIEAVQKTAREGKVIAMSIGLGDAIDGGDLGIDDIREDVVLDGDLNERLDYLLAIFLVCAEKYSYVYPHDGYNSLTSVTWLKTFSQYEKKLGEPKGYAKQEGYTYTREFEHLDVFLDIKNKTAKLNYK
jgi:hypothetical protein